MRCKCDSPITHKKNTQKKNIQCAVSVIALLHTKKYKKKNSVSGVTVSEKASEKKTASGKKKSQLLLQRLGVLYVRELRFRIRMGPVDIGFRLQGLGFRV